MTVLRPVVMRLTVLVLTATLCMVLGELFLRAMGISYPSFFMPDPLTGFWHRPGVAGVYRLEGEGRISIDRDGMRGPDYEQEKPAKAFRVAVLGDSYAEAFQVDLRESFPAILEQRLGECPALEGLEVQVLNFGVSGFGTAQELLVWRQRARLFEPDAVVLAFVHNDVRNNSRELEGDPARPYFDWVDGQLVLDESFRDSESFRARTSPMRDLRRRLGDHSYLLQLLDEMRSVSLRRNVARTTIPIRGGMYGTPADPAWDKAWQTTEALIAALHDEVRADGALFLVVTLSDGPQVHPDPAWRATFAEENGVEDFFYSEKRIVRLARRENIPLLVLAPRLREIAESQSRCLHGFENAEPCQGHWNQLGHAIGGGLMGEALCQLATTRNETALPLPGLPGFEGL